MKWKKLGLLMAMVMTAAFVFAGCGDNGTKTDENGGDTAKTETPAKATEEASADGEVKPVVLVVSFGTSYNDSRDKTIGAVEQAITDAYPDYEIRRAFTSQIIIDKLKERDNLEIDNVEEALDRLVADGVKKLVVQPTHVMSGYEYDDVAAAVEEYKDQFDSVSMGAPLLTSDEDYTDLTNALVEATASYDDGQTAIVFMGHGTEHEANATYAKLQDSFAAKGAEHYYIGTVEATPSLDDIVAAVKEGGYKKVVLEPLMLVAGDHANNDMAGDEEDSWKSVLTKEGFEVECLLRGMGELPAIQEMYVSHVADAIGNLK